MKRKHALVLAGLVLLVLVAGLAGSVLTDPTPIRRLRSKVSNQWITIETRATGGDVVLAAYELVGVTEAEVIDDVRSRRGHAAIRVQHGGKQDVVTAQSMTPDQQEDILIDCSSQPSVCTINVRRLATWRDVLTNLRFGEDKT